MTLITVINITEGRLCQKSAPAFLHIPFFVGAESQWVRQNTRHTN